MTKVTWKPQPTRAKIKASSSSTTDASGNDSNTTSLNISGSTIFGEYDDVFSEYKINGIKIHILMRKYCSGFMFLNAYHDPETSITPAAPASFAAALEESRGIAFAVGEKHEDFKVDVKDRDEWYSVVDVSKSTVDLEMYATLLRDTSNAALASTTYVYFAIEWDVTFR